MTVEEGVPAGRGPSDGGPPKAGPPNAGSSSAGPSEGEGHRSGFVALVGRPNSGKSTLLNRIVGSRLAIVTRKAQTTRRRILGVARRPGLELVLVDTPGLHRPRHQLGRRMVRTALSAMDGADVVLAVVDATRRFGGEDAALVGRMRRFRGIPVFGVNKSDAVPAARVRELAERYRDVGGGASVVVFSAKTGAGVERMSPGADSGEPALLDVLAAGLPFGPALYPDGEITDLSEAFLASETVRERALIHLRQEIPHAVAVRIESFDDTGDIVRIEATVMVDRESHRGIVIGRKAAMLKKIGSEAREAVEKRVGRQVFLGLQVRVRAGWRDNPGILRDLGV